MITAMSLTNGTLNVIFDNGAEILTARSDQPNWNEIISAYKAQNSTLLRMLMSAKSVMETYSHGDITINGTGILYRGRPLHGVDVDRTLAFQRENLPYEPLALYMERKLKNPSARSIEQLYPFLEHKNMSLTPRGTFIAYKGVQKDYYSVKGNTSTVVLQGVVNEGGHILNSIGAVIVVERSSVDDNFNNGCSFGLHAGSLAYASGWGERVLLIEIDPADVVSVPEDCNCQKLRCCKYKVIGEYTGPLPDTYTSEFDDEEVPSVTKSLDEELFEELFDEVEHKNETPSNELEQVAQDAGILSGGPEPEDLVAGGIEGDLDEYETDYLKGMKDGIQDRMAGNEVKYIAGDQLGADSARHAQYIDGYIIGYK
jgi:hypothetical protein